MIHIDRHYRAVLIPHAITKKTLLRMREMLNTGLEDDDPIFTCLIFNGYTVTEEHWQWPAFLHQLSINLSGAGFSKEYLPDWFRSSFYVSEFSNTNRLTLINDILKEVYDV